MSATALEAGSHLVRASQLTTRPGALPTVTIPVAGGRWPDPDGIWSHLADCAEFFGIEMPTVGDLTAAIGDVATRTTDTHLAVTVVIVETDTGSDVVATGLPVRPLRSTPVVVVDDSMPPAHRSTDPWWQRMAARTTSRAEVDQRERWLLGRGCSDALSGGVPLLGAVVAETHSGCVGVENPEPTSVLDQLAACGWTAPIARAATLPDDVLRAWWVSPRFETHPVAELAGTHLPSAVAAVPSFGRWS